MYLNEILKNIIWLGQSGFIIHLDNKTIIIDPYESKVTALADIILITHPHWDHLSSNDIDKFNYSKTKIVADAESGSKIVGNVQIRIKGNLLTRYVRCI